jgi:hypothetical protein
MTQLMVENVQGNNFKKNLNSSIIGACDHKRDEPQKTPIVLVLIMISFSSVNVKN